jgi:hypothetical protein
MLAANSKKGVFLLLQNFKVLNWGKKAVFKLFFAKIDVSR